MSAPGRDRSMLEVDAGRPGVRTSLVLFEWWRSLAERPHFFCAQLHGSGPHHAMQGTLSYELKPGRRIAPGSDWMHQAAAGQLP